MNINDTIAADVGHVSSYPSIYNLGHSALGELFDGNVVIEEKIDGSQFSFRLNADETISCRSKGKELIVGAPEKMFELAVQTVESLAHDLRVGYTYRGEFLAKPKHNTLAYGRVPKQHIILFDIEIAPQQFLGPDEKFTEADRLGLECVPLWHRGWFDGTADDLLAMIDHESCLGSVKAEGLVVKNYERFGKDKKVLMGKFVSEAFKERHGKEWKDANPTRTDIIQQLIAEFKTEARWKKAVQHLKESGTIEGSPRDIGLLIKEIPDDIKAEAEQEIRDRLFAYAWPQIRRGVTGGFPEWYKEQLLRQALDVSGSILTSMTEAIQGEDEQ